MFRFAAAAIVLVASASAASAFDDGAGADVPWPFGRYSGSDLHRPSTTPDQPHWHGDDAVPLALRWRDQGWEGMAAEQQQGLAVESYAEQTSRMPPDPGAASVRSPHSRKRSATHRHRRAYVCRPLPR